MNLRERNIALLDKVYQNIWVLDKINLKSAYNDCVLDLVDEFLDLNEQLNYPQEILLCSESIDPIKIGCLFDICTWSTNDNGGKQAREMQKYLFSDDIRNIEISLCVVGIFPLNDFTALKKRILEIEMAYPSLKYACDYWKKRI